MLYLRFDQERKKPFYAAALALFVLGLLSKTVTATLPAALLVIFWWKRGKLSWRRDVLPLAPFFVLGAAASLFTAWVERKLIGAEGAAFDLTFVDRFLIAGRVIWFYLGKLFWPANLIFIYPRWNISQAVWWQYLFPAAALFLAAVLWVLRRRWRGPLAGLLFFVGTLFPVLGFFNVFPFIYSFVADHFQYLASLGVIALVSAGIALLLKPWAFWPRIGGYAICFIMLSTLAILTWRQSRMYVDIEMLYQTTIEKNPNCWLAYNNLGLILDKMGQTQEAIDHFRQTLAIKPDYAMAQNNWGVVLVKTGRMQEAIEHYKLALQLDHDYATAYNNLGVVLDKTGRTQEAIDHYKHALMIRPDYIEAHNNLGIALVKTGRFQEALEHYNQALALQPDYLEVLNNLGAALIKTGLPQEAIEHYQQALRLNPDSIQAHYNLGNAFVQTGRIGEGIDHYKEALRLKPDFIDAHNNLAVALMRTGRPEEAIEHFQHVLLLKPDFTEVYFNLALLYELMHKSSDAIEAGRKALELAQSKNQTALAKRIENWLNNYRAGQSNHSK